tara:strand:- start:9968 stop:10396 length:429 start_codon:yes stop_codon:yes gene_type:complete
MRYFHEATVQEIEDIVNHDDIAPALGIMPDRYMDMSHAFDNEGNVCLMSNIGGMFFANAGDGVYDSHFLFIPGSGGAEIKDAAHAMITEMFTRADVKVITGAPPRDNRAVRHMGTALGYIKIPRSEHFDGLGRLCDKYEVRK